MSMSALITLQTVLVFCLRLILLLFCAAILFLRLLHKIMFLLVLFPVHYLTPVYFQQSQNNYLTDLFFRGIICQLLRIHKVYHMSSPRVCYMIYSQFIRIDESRTSESLREVYYIDSFTSTDLNGAPAVTVDEAFLKGRSHAWLLSDLYAFHSSVSGLPLIFHSPEVAFNYALGVLDFEEALFQDFTFSFPLVPPVSFPKSPYDSILQG